MTKKQKEDNMTISYEMDKNYRICKICHCIFPEDNFKLSCQPNTIPITKCPYCKENKNNFVKQIKDML